MSRVAIALSSAESLSVCWGPDGSDRKTIPLSSSWRRPFGRTLRYWRKQALALGAGAITLEALTPKTPTEVVKIYGQIEGMADQEGATYDESVTAAALVAGLERRYPGIVRADYGSVREYRLAVARERCGWEGSSIDEASAVLLWHYVDDLRQRGVA